MSARRSVGAASYAAAGWKDKGKQRARDVDEGSGGSGGIVLPLDQIGTTAYDIAYAVAIQVGTNNLQNLSLEVDSGSSDLWIASTSCSSSSCSGAKGRLYDPNSANQTGESFNINYLSGNVSGPIVWDQVQIGGYSISNQALAAASSVTNEPLTYNFDGILGLALPMNSIISQKIPPLTSNSPDGAAFASNLFSITPASTAPSARFLSLSLSRPGSTRIPARLGIGRHPTEIVSDPSKINYSTLVSAASGTLFWKVDVRAITVYANGLVKPVMLPRSVSGGAFPTAVMDSGVPVIVTTSEIANGIYGAIGIGPAANGEYYVPCDTPLNMTITLDGQQEIPLHPLDLTAEPLTDPSSQYCVGLIQADDAQLTSQSDIGDMILGVPFMRNTYTVMAYEPPDAQGNFNTNSSAADSVTMSQDITPRLGLLNLTNPTIAMEEFHQVRVLNQPLSPGPSATDTQGKGMSVGIKVLIGLVSFFGLCIAMFAVRWVLLKRRWRRQGAASRAPVEDGERYMKKYTLARRGSSSLDEPSEDTLRTLRYETYKKERMYSEYTTSTGVDEICHDQDSDDHPGEFGYRPTKRDSAAPTIDIDLRDSLGWRDTLVGDPTASPEALEKELSSRPAHIRTLSEISDAPAAVSIPLLAHTRDDSRAAEGDLAEFGMVGVGTATRSSRLDSFDLDFRPGNINMGSLTSSLSVGGTRARPTRSPTGPRPPSYDTAKKENSPPQPDGG